MTWIKSNHYSNLTALFNARQEIIMYKKFFNFRIDPQTSRKLTILADTVQRTKSNLVRWLISQEYIRCGLNLLEDNKVSSIEDEIMGGVE